MKITIISPKGFKMWLDLPREKVEAWGNEMVTLSHFDVGRITFNFMTDKENMEAGNDIQDS